jgi:hypothetical protein
MCSGRSAALSCSMKGLSPWSIRAAVALSIGRPSTTGVARTDARGRCPPRDHINELTDLIVIDVARCRPEPQARCRKERVFSSQLPSREHSTPARVQNVEQAETDPAAIVTALALRTGRTGTL